MRAQVLIRPTLTSYGRSYRAPLSLNFCVSSSSSRFLNLSLSRFFHMEGLYLASSTLVLCLFVFSSAFTSDGSTCFESLEFDSSGTGNKAMVENLKRFGVISCKRVAQVMEELDRALFVPVGSSAYVDTPLPIGFNATISAPHMHATCLQLLQDKLQPGMRALDVGSGTGYLTGCFALMVGAEGRVVGVDHIPELVEMSIKNIEKSAAASLLQNGSLSLHLGDGRKGWEECAPYDAIHVGAAASEIPQALLDQLKPGGRMVIPVGTYFQELKVIDKSEDGSIKAHTETSVRYVPLTSRDEQLGGF